MAIRHFIAMAPIVIYIAWEQIYFYFFSNTKSNTARGVLTFTSFKIMKDCFPIGMGFGTFASSASGDYYSQVYFDYGISDVWGLKPEWPGFVSDTFWPMIIGQTGFLGLLVYVYIIFVLFREIQQLFVLNKKVYLSALSVMVYLLVSSVAESAFVNPLAVPLAWVLGICFIFKERSNLQNKIKS